MDKKEQKRFLRSVLRNQDKISNLARYMLDDQLFLEARQQMENNSKDGGDDDESEDEQILAQPGDGKGKAVTLGAMTTQSPLHPLVTNQRVEIDNASFKAKQFFFSNNDKYFGVIGATELIAFDSRTGREVYRRSFPEGDWRPLMPQLGPGVDGPGHRPSTSVARAPAKKVTICSHAQYDHSAGHSRCGTTMKAHSK